VYKTRLEGAIIYILREEPALCQHTNSSSSKNVEDEHHRQCSKIEETVLACRRSPHSIVFPAWAFLEVHTGLPHVNGLQRFFRKIARPLLYILQLEQAIAKNLGTAALAMLTNDVTTNFTKFSEIDESMDTSLMPKLLDHKHAGGHYALSLYFLVRSFEIQTAKNNIFCIPHFFIVSAPG